jgi:hypothetical protein
VLSAEIQPVIQAIELPQTHALKRTATGVGSWLYQYV